MCRRFSHSTTLLAVISSTGSTAFLLAAEQGHLGCLKLLVNAAQLNQVSFRGNTPLILAAEYRHPECVDFLIRSQADLYWQNIKGESLGLAWWDSFPSVEDCIADPEPTFGTGPELREVFGYIGDGGTVEYRTMSVEAAKAECIARQDCRGITFAFRRQCDSLQATQGECAADDGDIQVVEFKNHSHTSPSIAVLLSFIQAAAATRRGSAFFPSSAGLCTSSTPPATQQRASRFTNFRLILQFPVPHGPRRDALEKSP